MVTVLIGALMLSRDNRSLVRLFDHCLTTV